MIKGTIPDKQLPQVKETVHDRRRCGFESSSWTLPFHAFTTVLVLVTIATHTLHYPFHKASQPSTNLHRLYVDKTIFCHGRNPFLLQEQAHTLTCKTSCLVHVAIPLPSWRLLTLRLAIAELSPERCACDSDQFYLVHPQAPHQPIQ